MMTREEVMEAANAKPNGFGFSLKSMELFNFFDLSEDMRRSAPLQWASLISASNEDDFYTELIELWHQGCGVDAFAPKFLKENLRYAGFTSIRGGGLRIEYVCEYPGNDGSLSHFSALPPIEDSKLHECPNYGPLTIFCRKVHGSVDSLSSGTFLRHPAWVSVNPVLGTVRRAELWSKFYTETLEDMEEPMTFSEGSTDKTDDKNFRPNPDTTFQFSDSISYDFVEPGNRTRFWRFWSSRGDMELLGENHRGRTANPVDECLSYILGADLY